MIFNILDKIFTDNEHLIEFLKENNIITATRRCSNDSCDGVAKLLNYKCGQKESIVYRCLKRSCRKRNAIFNTKLSASKYIHILFLLLTGCTYHQIYIFHNISNTTITRLKNTLRDCYKKFMNDRPIFLGGLGCVVEADETVLSRRGIIASPTSFSDLRRDTIWILGVIDNTPNKNFFIKRIPDRTIESITTALEGVVRCGSRFYTDGYPSYPRVAENLSLNHSVVNHSSGFISTDGTHTNNQEGFWSHLKASMRKEHGVKRENIDIWIDEYTFKRRYIIGSKREEVCTIFIELLKYLLN